ncbi:MAG: toprim domain-containing protein [Rhodobacteraceae bacterium]|nr:toprim domain-containing protein [Paracoccaceae bacterium]
MSEAQTITLALHGDFRNGSGLAPCPICQPEAQRDQRALSISESGGRLLLYCHKGGCKVFPELQARGLIDGHGQHASPPDPAEAEQRRQRDQQKQAQRLAHCHEIFNQARTCEGTIAQTYLEDVRGIEGLRFHKMKNTLRFAPEVMHSPSGQKLPAIIARIRGVDGRPLGIHRTYLCPDGSGKADVTPAKMMLGPSSGGAVRFGPDGPVIALAEGIETALSVARASRLTVWATLSTSGLKGLILPPPPVGEVVIICADNDEAGLSAAKDKAARLEAEGRAVSIIHPPKAGDDFNDVLRGKK